MKLSTALLLLAFGASDADRAGTRRRAQDGDDVVTVFPADEEIEIRAGQKSPFGTGGKKGGKGKTAILTNAFKKCY